MNADHKFLSPPQKSKTRLPLVLAILVHLLLVLALFLGVQWKTKIEVVELEVWGSGAPNLGQENVEPEAQREPEPEPPKSEPPKPDPIPEVKPEVKPEVRPDILLEAEKRKKEEARKKQAEKEKEDKRKADDAKKEKDRLDKEKRDKEAADKKAKVQSDKEKADRIKAFTAEAGKETGIAGSKGNAVASTRKSDVASLLQQAGSESGSNAAKSKYADKIANAVRNNIILPPSISGNPEMTIKIVLLPSYEVAEVKIEKSSGNKALDEAVERAIFRSSPFPKVEPPLRFQDVRQTILIYKPYEKSLLSG